MNQCVNIMAYPAADTTAISSTRISPQDISLAEMIAECQGLRGKIQGYRYIQLWLEKVKGVHRNPKTVLRVMRKYGLLSEVRRKRWQGCGQAVHRYINILNRNFTAEHPNQKWVTDISYIPTAQGFLYLSVIGDLFDNSIVAYKTSKQQTANLVLDTVHSAMVKEKVAGSLYLHSDQGIQYTSHAYFTLTQEYGITPTMARCGNPYDNAMAENIISMLKASAFHDRKYSPLSKRNS